MRPIALTPALASLGLVLLTGCRIVPPGSNPPPVSPETCGADIVRERWLNSLPTDEVKAYIAARVGERPIRYYTIGDPITMDYSPARLNIELGNDGRIKRVRCG